MTPWPADVQQPQTFAPSPSPMQQSSFASYGATPAAEQSKQEAPKQDDVDPWASMMAPTVPTQAPPPVPAPTAPLQPGQQTQEQVPTEVVTNPTNQSPPSPIGDMSVIAASAQQNQAAAGQFPVMYSQSVQPLQPSMQLVAEAPVAQPPAAPAQDLASANPFDNFGAQMAASMPPAAAAPMPLTEAPPAVPGEHVLTQQPAIDQAFSPLTPIPNSAAFTPQVSDPFGYAFSPMTSPVTSPSGSPGNSGALVISSAPNADPFGVFGGNQASPQPTDPFGVSNAAPPLPSAAVVDDPFGIFGGAPTQAAQPAPVQEPINSTSAPAKDEDLWADAGFGQAVQKSPTAPAPSHAQATIQSQPSLSTVGSYRTIDNQQLTDMPGLKLDEVNHLPTTGEYYEARIAARTLGAMFYTPSDVKESLFAKVPPNVVTSLGSRPVVSYVASNSAAHNAGVHLGHIIIQVNGENVTDPENGAYIIRNAQRPMILRCYVPPNLNLTVSEGRHMVKYDSKEMCAPSGAGDWKKKFVTVGGIVAKPWLMNMYYSKRDYDIAVKEAHARHKISVKVKQFDIRGARIILGGSGGKPDRVNYKTERLPWYYFTILPNKGFPIKISADSLERLEPVYAAIRKFVRKDMEDRYVGAMELSFGRDGTNGSSDVHANFGAPKTDTYWK